MSVPLVEASHSGLIHNETVRGNVEYSREAGTEKLS